MIIIFKNSIFTHFFIMLILINYLVSDGPTFKLSKALGYGKAATFKLQNTRQK